MTKIEVSHLSPQRRAEVRRDAISVIEQSRREVAEAQEAIRAAKNAEDTMIDLLACLEIADREEIEASDRNSEQ